MADALTPASSPSHFLVTMRFRDRTVKGTFRNLSGGNPTAEARRYRPGGSPSQEVSGGPKSRDDLVLGREWRPDRDLELFKWCDLRCGRARASVTMQPLDEDYNAFGDPLVYSDALLIGATKPDVDSEATGDTATLGLTFAVSGEVA